MSNANFLFLFRGGDAAALISPEKMQAHMEQWGQWMKKLNEQGHLQGGDPLEMGGRVIRGTKKLVSDGPYAEAKDVVAG